MTETETKLYTRWMIRRDLPRVVAVDRAAGGDWTTKTFLAHLSQRKCIGMVAEPVGAYDRRAINGVLVYELHRDHLRVLKLAATSPIAAEVQAALWEKLLFKLGSHRREHLDLSALVRPGWRTDTVQALCRADNVYLPILADALEEAGCADRWLLDTFRGDVRGADETAAKIFYGILPALRT